MRRNLLLFALLTVVTSAPSQTWAQETSLIGKPAREFVLNDVVTAKDVALSQFKGKVVVVIFYSHTCTFCRNYEARFRQFAAEHSGKGVAILAIDSSGRDANEASTAWREKKMGFPLLRDDRARTAAALGATAMTTVCLVDAPGNLRYIGAFDDSESGKDIRSRFVADAVASLLAGRAVQHEQTEVYACMIPPPQ